MLDTLLLAAALHLAPADTSDRNDALNRPSRGTVARVAVDASQIPSGWLAFAQCVEQRESNGQADAVNKFSGAAGLYQWMPAWRTGLPYMVRDRLIDYGMPAAVARQIRRDLAYTPIERWHPLWQRIGFAAVISSGSWKHWYLAGSRCNGLVP